MKEGWPVRTLSEVCQIRPPKSEARDALKDDDLVSFVPMNDLPIREKRLNTNGERPLGKVYGGYTYFAERDVLLAKITPCFENGKLGIARDLKNSVGFGSSEFFVLRPNESVEPEFLFYFLCQDRVRDSGKRVMSGAVGHKRVPKEFIEQLPLPLPTPYEQKRIVAILDEAFAGIETAIANTEKNLANARELFESFLNTQLAAVACSPKSQALSNITELIVDCEHKTAPTQETGYASIRTPNIGKGILDPKNVRRVSAEVYRQWTRRAVPQPGDLILAREAPAGNVGVVPDGEKVCLGQRTVLIRPNNSQIDSKYLAYLILHPAIQHRLLETSSGATVQHVNMRDIRALGLGDLPSLSSQSQDVEAIEFVQQEALQLETKCCNKLERLAELKQSLLQKAFSGELTADRAEEELESATA